MRYIKVPEDVRILDAITDADMNESFTFAKTVRVLCAAAMQDQSNPMSVFDAADIRALFDKAKHGDVVPLADSLWSAISVHCKRMPGASVHLAMSAIPHLRSILEAPSEAPAN